MKNLLLLTLCLLITASTFGQKTEIRKISSFDKISVNSVIKVELYQSNSNEIEIYTENVPTEKVISKIRNGELTLDLENRKKGWDNIEITVKVPFKELTEITTSTASSLSSKETLKLDKLDISMGEASQVNLSLECNTLDVAVGSAARLHLEGTCKSLEAHINSAAQLNAYELKVIDADIRANSMAKVKVNVKNNLHISANSMAKVTYMGKPANLQETKSSMASIRQVSGNLKEISN